MILYTSYKYIKENLEAIFCNPISYILCIAWGSPLLGYWRGINNKIPILKDYTNELEWAIIIVPLICCLKNIPYLIKIRDVLFVYLCLCVYLLNFFFFPQNSEFLYDRLFSFSILVLPYFFVGVVLNIDKYINVFYFVSILVIGITVFYNIFYVKSGSYSGIYDSSEYDMYGSYNILPHVLLVSWIAIRDLDIKKILLMVVGVVLLLSMGTRGPVLCEIFFVCIYLFFFKYPKIHLVIKLFVIALFVFILRFIEQFMLLMNNVLTKIGLSTRIFDKYFEEELFDFTGRDDIISNLLLMLKNEDVIFGYGILGSYNYTEGYPHNIFIDFIFSFGWFIGIALLVMLSILIYSAFKYSNNETQRAFILLLISASIIKLFVSGTYLDETFFFMLIGFCIHCIRYKNSLLSYQE